MTATHPVSDPGVLAAVRQSFIGDLPAETVEWLLEDAWEFAMPAGSHWVGDAATHGPAIVLTGRICVYLCSDDGRSVAVRCAAPGAVLGFAECIPSALRTEATVPTRLLRINPRRLDDLAERDAAVAHRITQEVSRQLHEVLDELAMHAFAPVRQRAARCLAQHASRTSGNRRVFVRVTHQELADSIGSVREVVGRVLRELRAEGLVMARPNGIEVVDVDGLQRASRPSASHSPPFVHAMAEGT